MSRSPGTSVPRVELAAGYSIAWVINGCWQLSRGHGGNTDSRSKMMGRLSGLVEAGFTTFDCADIYTGVESLLGEFIRGLADPGCVEVHTKFVPDLDELSVLSRHRTGAIIDRSLKRLGVERLDLVQFHWWDYSVPGYLDTLADLDDLRTAGKIRHLGLTNFDTRRVGEIIESGIRVTSLQLQYSLLDRRPKKAMARLCSKHDIGLLAYGALAGGLFSERQLGQTEMLGDNRSLQKYRLMVREAGGWSGFQSLLETLRAIATEHGTGIPAVAARWVLDRPGVAAVILGIGSGMHVEENLILSSLELSAAQNDAIDHALAGLNVPAGDVFELERDPLGPHLGKMKMNLNTGSEP